MRDLDLESSLDFLTEHGYVVLEGLLDQSSLEQISNEVDRIFDQEREIPYDPGDGPLLTDDRAIEAYLGKSYEVSEAELARVMRRIRHTRALNYGTPWPVPPAELNESFIHLPTLFDHDRSQRIWNLPSKTALCSPLIENPTLLKLIRAILGPDCLLSDISVTSIGPDTNGGAWHVDAPLTQMPDPLPEAPLTVENVWLLDDFTAHHGATRVVPGSHRLRKKSDWSYDPLEGEATLTAPVGSMAVWISNTWHRSGPNSTTQSRRAILSYYCRSWVKPFSDYPASIQWEMAEAFSPTARYLLGWSASGPTRG